MLHDVMSGMIRLLRLKGTICRRRRYCRVGASNDCWKAEETMTIDDNMIIITAPWEEVSSGDFFMVNFNRSNSLVGNIMKHASISSSKEMGSYEDYVKPKTTILRFYIPLVCSVPTLRIFSDVYHSIIINLCLPTANTSSAKTTNLYAILWIHHLWENDHLETMWHSRHWDHAPQSPRALIKWA